jgi:hypothetical protein
LKPEFLSAGNTVFLVGRHRISDPMDQAQDVLFDPRRQVNVSMTQSASKKCANVQYPLRGFFKGIEWIRMGQKSNVVMYSKSYSREISAN